MRTPPEIIAANIRTLMDDNQIPSESDLARKAKVDQKTVWRILRQQQSPTVDTLEKLAKPFKLHAWQLLIPDLNPRNPPVFVMTDTEREMYCKLARMASEFVASEPNAQYGSEPDCSTKSAETPATRPSPAIPPPPDSQ